MNIKKKLGQSTVEYILLVTAVIAILIVFLTSANSPFKKQLNAALNTTTSDMNSMAGRLMGSETTTTP